MFKNIGNKLKVWAKVQFVILLFSAAVLLVLGIVSMAISKAPAVNYLILAASAIISMFSSLVLGYYIYGLGSVVAARKSINNKLNCYDNMPTYSVSLGKIVAYLCLVFCATYMLFNFFETSSLFFNEWNALSVGKLLITIIFEFILPFFIGGVTVSFCIFFIKGDEIYPLVAIATSALLVCKIYELIVAGENITTEEIVWMVAIVVYILDASGLFKLGINLIMPLSAAVATAFAYVTYDKVINGMVIISFILILFPFMRQKYIIADSN